MSERQLVPLSKLRTDGGTQFRQKMDREMITDISIAVRNGEHVDDAVAFFDDKHYWLADGNQRKEGYAKADKSGMPCQVRHGTQRDAILYAAGANAKHGGRRSAQEARNAIAAVLSDPEWCEKSNVWIADKCHVSDKTVQSVREEMEQSKAGQKESTSTTFGNSERREEDSEGDKSQETRTDTKGRKQPAKKPKERDLRCGRCKRLNINDPEHCPECKAAKERYLARKGAKGKPRTAKESKNGAMMLDWKEFDKLYGPLRRYIDAIFKQNGMTKTPIKAGIDRLCKEFVDGWRSAEKEAKKLLKEKARV